MNNLDTLYTLKKLEARVYGLGDALIVIADRIDGLLNRRNEYLRTTLAEVSRMARKAVEEDKDHE